MDATSTTAPTQTVTENIFSVLEFEHFGSSFWIPGEKSTKADRLIQVRHCKSQTQHSKMIMEATGLSDVRSRKASCSVMDTTQNTVDLCTQSVCSR